MLWEVKRKYGIEDLGFSLFLSFHVVNCAQGRELGEMIRWPRDFHFSSWWWVCRSPASAWRSLSRSPEKRWRNPEEDEPIIAGCSELRVKHTEDKEGCAQLKILCTHLQHGAVPHTGSYSKRGSSGHVPQRAREGHAASRPHRAVLCSWGEQMLQCTK